MSPGLDRDLLSFHAHAAHPVACPFSDGTVTRIVGSLRLPATADVLDAGCGRGAWLLRLLQVYPGTRATGIDRSPLVLAEARLHAARLGLAERCRFVEGDATPLLAELGTFELAICLGAVHALGGREEAVRRLRDHVRPDGLLLVADGFWQRPPTRAALAALGAAPTDFPDLGGLVESLAAFGQVLEVWPSGAAEWDAYESAWCEGLRRWAGEAPDPQAVLEVARDHQRGYEQGYRGVLGFAAVLLRA